MRASEADQTSRWCHWLNDWDLIDRAADSDRQRAHKKAMERLRIATRELARAEVSTRTLLCDDESTERLTIVAKCGVIAKHKMEQQRLKRVTVAPSVPRISWEEPHRRSAAVSAITIRNGTTPRSVLKDSKLSSEVAALPLSPSPSHHSPSDNTFAAKAKAWEEAQSARSPGEAHMLFDRSRHRVEQQQEGRYSMPLAHSLALSRRHSTDAERSCNEQEYAGPFRTDEAMMRSPSHAFRLTTAVDVYDPPYPSTNDAATVMRSDSLRSSQARAERHFQPSVNWDAVFNTNNG